MASSQPLSTPVPAPSLNIPGLSCTGTMCGSNVNYQCHRIPIECAAVGGYEFEHLLKPQFWILLCLLFFITRNTSSEDAYHAFLELIAKLRLGRPQPRSRATQVVALLVYLGILWLVWFEEYMVLSTEWHIARKVFVVWRPSLTPLRFRLLALYPAWAVVSVFCIAVVAATITVGVSITEVQLGCVKQMASLVMGRKELDSRVLGEYEAGGDEENKANETEAAKVPGPSDEKNRGLLENVGNVH
ncbi:hypothetical protein F4782DRAFT_523572 [Xylaria castorea]|nr:hypothetical protein F4782DRAFT_523572 [Xylaria castorea]